MKTRQLEAFRAVMLYRTVTLASEMLHISQPATTRLLADLESSLRIKLFDRVKGRLHPTVEAQALYEEVQRSLVGMDRIARAADESGICAAAHCRSRQRRRLRSPFCRMRLRTI